MSTFGGNRVHADPKTPTQLRAALAATQTHSDATDDDVSELAAQVGPVTATFTATGGIGQPVYVSGASSVNLADADSPSTAGVVGLVSTAAGAGQPGAYIAFGVLTLANWTAITGSASLTPGSVYWLSSTTGQLTTTAPTSTGKTVVRCGRALTATSMMVAIEPGVLL